MRQAEQGWTIEELRAAVAAYEAELKTAGLKPTTVVTYVDRTERFLRWLIGEYQPLRSNE